MMETFHNFPEPQYASPVGFLFSIAFITPSPIFPACYNVLGMDSEAEYDGHHCLSTCPFG